MRNLICRSRLIRCIAMDLAGEDLTDFSFDDITEAIPLAIACAKTRADRSPNTKNISYYRYLRQLEGCYKKRCPADGSVPQNLIDEALTSFFNVEMINHQSNHRLKQVPPNPKIRSQLLMARDWIHRILPPLDRVEDEVYQGCGFGPGAVFAAGGPLKKHVLSKLEGQHTVTEDCFQLAKYVIEMYFPSWYQSSGNRSLKVVKGNRLAFVAKDENKCRTIAVEPSLNMFIQKGVGKYFEKILYQNGIDITDQNTNRRLAKRGSITGNLATIDLSDASSRIPRQLVRYLLPPDWFALCDTIRSKVGLLPDGKNHSYEMFSSQGNAFTFPLETLIFYALCGAAQGSFARSADFSVYGDDIICPTTSFHDVSDILEWVGGQVNYLKSFHYGSFRESCGGDFFAGLEVRPIYYKSDATLYSDVAKLHNLLMEKWGWENVPRTLEYLVSCVPKDKIIWGPSTIISTDVRNELINVLSRNYDRWFWAPLWNPSYKYDPEIQAFVVSQRYWSVKAFLPKDFLTKFSEDTLLLGFLYGGTRLLESSPLSRLHIGRTKFSLSAGRGLAVTAPR